jgi:large subunit ribosomal protein L10
VPISRARKEEQVARYVELLSESTGFAIVSPSNLPVNKIEALRRQVRDAGGEYVVGKNTLVIKALEQAGWVVPQEQLVGQTAVIFGKDAFPDVAKALLAFIEKEKLEDDKLKVIGGVMGKDVLKSTGVKAVSELPTLPELQAQIIGLIVAPATNIVSILDAANAGVVNVIQALLDKDKDDGSAA